MSIPRDQYYEYREMIEHICKYGDKEQLERLYREIIARYGHDDDLYTLDKFYNYRWRIL
jgi:hypothetical protein